LNTDTKNNRIQHVDKTQNVILPKLLTELQSIWTNEWGRTLKTFRSLSRIRSTMTELL